MASGDLGSIGSSQPLHTHIHTNGKRESVNTEDGWLEIPSTGRLCAISYAVQCVASYAVQCVASHIFDPNLHMQPSRGKNKQQKTDTKLLMEHNWELAGCIEHTHTHIQTPSHTHTLTYTCTHSHTHTHVYTHNTHKHVNSNINSPTHQYCTPHYKHPSGARVEMYLLTGMPSTVATADCVRSVHWVELYTV